MEEKSLVARILGTYPESLTEDLLRALVGSRYAASLGSLSNELRDAEAAVKNALDVVFPADVLDVTALVPMLQQMPGDILKAFGADRVLWTALRAGKGKRTDPRALETYLVAASEWLKLTMMANLAADLDKEGVLEVELIAKQEVVRRLMPDTIQYQWVSRLIFDAASTLEFPGMEFLSVTAVEELFRYIDSSTQRFSSAADHAAAWEMLGDDTKELCRSFCSMNPFTGSIAQLMSSTEAERSPFIWLNDFAVPGVRLVANFSLETALFAMAREKTTNNFGRWFELVVAKAVSEVAPFAANLAEPVTIPTQISGNPGQVDFALIDDKCLALIGEVKGFAVTDRIASISGSLSKLSEARKQLEVRLDALRAGSKLHGSGAEHHVSGAFGLGITLHSYAGALWRSGAVSAIGEIRTDIALIPLTQALMVIAAMNSLEELGSYVQLRQKSMNERRIIAGDEVDLLLAYTNADFRERLESVDMSAVIMVPIHSVSHAHSSGPRPTSFGTEWLKRLHKEAAAIVPPLTV